MRTCTKCGETKTDDNFWKDRSKKHGSMAQCKECRRKYMGLYRNTIRPEYNKERYQNNRDSERERHLMKKYGIGFAEYFEMLKNQNGLCAICGKTEPENRTFDVDHDHKTGEVRGLLCTSCNRMLGHSGDSAEVLTRGSKYLSSRKSRQNS